MAETLPVAAVVLNWNNYADTHACVESLRSLDPGVDTIVVVDNGSTDGSGERLDEEFPEVEVRFTGENLGFAGGMNDGIDAALDDAEFVWLLNNDVVFLEEDVLTSLCGTLDRDDVAGVSPLIRKYPETDDIWFWRGFVDWDRGYAAHDPPGAFDAQEVGEYVSNNYIPCCAFLVRASLVEERGGLPTDYFLYYEDVDFCTRLRDDDYQLLTVTDAAVHHRVSASSGSDTGPIPAYYLARNRILFAREFDEKVSDAFYQWYTLGILDRLKWYVMCREWESVTALLRGVADGLRGRTGKGPYP